MAELWDVAIIGAGPAGLAAAEAIVAERSWRVVVVDAGPARGARGRDDALGAHTGFGGASLFSDGARARACVCGWVGDGWVGGCAAHCARPWSSVTHTLGPRRRQVFVRPSGERGVGTTRGSSGWRRRARARVACHSGRGRPASAADQLRAGRAGGWLGVQGVS